MANSYQLVAWTDKGQVRMIPSLINEYIQEEMKRIHQVEENVRYGTRYEVHDLLKLSNAYEKLALVLQGLGESDTAFNAYSKAALCCSASDNNWEDTEWGELLFGPLRRRFFEMFSACKDLIHFYPKLQYYWANSGLQEALENITHRDRMIEYECERTYGNVREAIAYSRALRFGNS